MAKGNGNTSDRQTPSRNTKPYDANNSFVKKVATKVTDLIPQSSWISKWFNTSQGNEDGLERENLEEAEFEDDAQQPPPSKRPRIRMDVIHPPGTFSIQPRVKTALNTVDPSKKRYSVINERSEDLPEPITAGPSGIGHLISLTPVVQPDVRTAVSHKSDLNSLGSTTNNGTTNGIDDVSESSESTSGCSSLIPQINRHEGPSSLLYTSTFSNRKRLIDDKLTFTNHLQSPRSLFLESNSRDTLSSRRPSFNASIMTNTLDRSSPLSSPFYNGNTTYGGANAAGLYKRNRNLFSNASELQLKIPRRTNVEVKPSNITEVDSSGMSQTARKILETLEHFSSPISDAKKIPLNNTDSAASLLTSKKRSREESAIPSPRIGLRHLTRELTVPTVPDIMQLKRRQKLQDTTVAARKIVSARSDPPRLQDYSLRIDNNSTKHHGKVKGKSKINIEEEETVEPVNLPNIPLPISILPSFNFTLSPTSADKTITDEEDTFTFASPIKVTDASKNLKSVNNFTFSNPIIAEGSENDINNINSPSKTSNVESTASSVDTTPVLNFIWSGSSTAPKLRQKIKSDKNLFGHERIHDLKSGNVIGVLPSNYEKTGDNFIGQSNSALISEIARTNILARAFGTDYDSDVKNKYNAEFSSISNVLKSPSDWECSECLIRNNSSDKQCTACKISRSKPIDKASSPPLLTNTTVKSKPVANDCFGSQFKLTTNQWECVNCYVRNKQNDVKCVACSAQKPEKSSATLQTTSTSTELQNSDIMDKFKPATGSWECSGCLLRNASNVITCPCCNTSKPISVKVSSQKIDTNTELSVQKLNSGDAGNMAPQKTSANSEIMNKFKPNKDSWECSGCLVRNSNSVTSCPCCNTTKPISVENSNKTEQKLTANGFGDKFKKPEGAWNCDSCLLQNDVKHTECVACQTLKPGVMKSNESASNTNFSSQFKFGIPSNAGGFKFGVENTNNQSKSDNVSPLSGFKFGNAQQNNDIPQFTFGIPKEGNKTMNEVSKSDNIATSVNPGSPFNVKSSEKSDTKLTQEIKQTIPYSTPKSEGSTTINNEKESTSIVFSTISNTPTFSFGEQKPGFNQPVLSKEAQKTSVATTVKVGSSESIAAVTNSISNNTSTTLSSLSTQNNAVKSTPKAVFSFGVPSSTNAASNNTSTSVTTTCLPSFAQSFTFSDSKITSQAATMPTFVQIPTSSSVLSTNLSFGENISVETSNATTNKSIAPVSDSSTTSIFPIVSSSTSLFNKDPKTTLAFGTEKSSAFVTTTSKPSNFTIENKIPTFGSTENKSSMFGTSETKLPVFGSGEKTTPVFNSPGQTPVANPLPTFGTPSNTTPALFGTSNTSFGNNTSSTFGTASTPAMFSSTKANETSASNSSLFTFGSTSVQAQPSAGNGFNFSANTNPVGSSQKPLFTFGSSSNAPQSNNLFGTGTFSNTAPTNSTSLSFNAPKQDPPIFGQDATTPMFGTPQANPQSQATSSFSSTSNTGFNFGSTAPPASSSGGFNFGGISSTSAPTGGFNFNSPTSNASTVAFNPNSRPSFNFTKGSAPTAFNATPQPASIPRKIKKAFRRCMR